MENIDIASEQESIMSIDPIATIGPVNYKGEEKYLTIYGGKSCYDLPTILGEPDENGNAKYLVMTGLGHLDNKTEAAVFIFDCKFKGDIKPGTSDIVFEEDVDNLINLHNCIKFRSKQVLADHIHSLQRCLDMWVEYDDRKEE